MPFLPAAIDSVLQQTFRDFELIMVNDGFPDNSAEIMEQYADRDSRIRTFHLPKNQGVCAAMNYGIHQARAPYIARMDADDLIHRERFAKQYAFMEKNPRIALVSSSFSCFFEEPSQPHNITYVPTNPHYIKSQMLINVPILDGAAMIRRAALDAVALPNGEIFNTQFPTSEDYELFDRICERFPVANQPDVFYQYRILQNSLSTHPQNKSLATAVRIRMLHRLGIDATPEQIAIHETMSSTPYQYLQTREFLESTLDWMELLLSANKEKRYFNQESLAMVLWVRWLRILERCEAVPDAKQMVRKFPQNPSLFHMPNWEYWAIKVKSSLVNRKLRPRPVQPFPLQATTAQPS